VAHTVMTIGSFSCRKARWISKGRRGMSPERLGRGAVVPKGVRHRLKSDKGVVVLDFEVKTTRKEGD